MSLKRIALLPCTLLCLSFGLLAAAHSDAQSIFSVFVDETDPASIDPLAKDFAFGLRSSANTAAGIPPFITFFQPNNGGFGQAYITPSAIRFGVTQTAGGNPTVASNQGAFDNAPAAFTFDLANGLQQDEPSANSPYITFLLEGVANGTIGYDSNIAPFSTTTFTVTSLQNASASAGQMTEAILSTDPSNGLPAFYIRAQVEGETYDLYVDQLASIAPPASRPTAVARCYVCAGQQSVAGHVMLQGLAASAAPQTVTFDFRNAAGTTRIFITTTVGADGSYILTCLRPGAYNVRVSGAKWLAQSRDIDITNSNATLDVTLPAGDINGDNTVDIADFGILLSAYGGIAGVSGSNYDVRADLNCDDIVDIGDFGLLIGNYGISGNL